MNVDTAALLGIDVIDRQVINEELHLHFTSVIVRYYTKFTLPNFIQMCIKNIVNGQTENKFHKTSEN